MDKPQKKKLRIVVKVIRKPTRKVSKGTWKVAYADFVTALMAFFLLLWLLSVSSKQYLMEISEYFRHPLSLARFGGRGENESPDIQYSGGRDLTRISGQVSKGMKLDAARAAMKNLERQDLEKLRETLIQAIEGDPATLPFRRQLLIDITENGLRIQIVDDEKRPMFDSGSAILQPYAERILHAIGGVLNAVPNSISIAGHTDAAPYHGSARNYDNWDLSMDRANAARRALIESGIDADKILRVTGLAAAVALDKRNPFDAVNRRISIVVLKHQFR